MKKENTEENTVEIKVDDFTLDPNKDVMVPMATYLALTNIIQEVEQKHSTRITSDVYSFYDRKTHKKLSNTNKVKMNSEKLAKEYYENIDMDASGKKVRVDRDDLGRAALRVLAEFRGIFESNVLAGNRIPRAKQAPDSKPEGLKKA